MYEEQKLLEIENARKEKQMKIEKEKHEKIEKRIKEEEEIRRQKEVFNEQIMSELNTLKHKQLNEKKEKIEHHKILYDSWQTKVDVLSE